MISDMLKEVIEKISETYIKIGKKMPNVCSDGVYDDHTGQWDNWTIGFWPGILWHAYAVTKEEKFRSLAVMLEEEMDEVLLDPERYSHDVGFMWLLSAVADYRLTGSKASANRGLRAAYILAGRFNPAGGFIRAWEGSEDEKRGYAIIDCMMNLPLLYWASEYTKDPRFRNIAVRHSDTTLTYFIREDGSSKHICVFDPEDGRYIKNLGGQGYDENSAWSRGNAWALYGFTSGYQHTGKREYLDTAMKCADFFLEHLPEDGVPFADFLAPKETNTHKDSSAAAIAASGLALLSALTEGKKSVYYKSQAERIVCSLYENYRDVPGSEAILKHGCGAYHAPESILDVGLIFGDYYFVEALLRLDDRKSFL